MTINRQAVINKISEKTGLYKKDIKEMLMAFKEVIYEELAQNNNIFIYNLFNIVPVRRKARKRYDCLKDIMYVKEEHNDVKIKPSVNLINSIRGKDIGNTSGGKMIPFRME